MGKQGCEIGELVGESLKQSSEKLLVTYPGAVTEVMENKAKKFYEFSATRKQIKLCFLIKLIMFQNVPWSLLAVSCDHLETRMTSQALRLHTDKQLLQNALACSTKFAVFFELS